VRQAADGRVTGLEAIHEETPVTYETDLVVDGAGALSLLQDKVDFDGTTFDTNVRYSQFCSAYREIVDVPEPVAWDDALVFKPTERAAGVPLVLPADQHRDQRRTRLPNERGADETRRGAQA
jgi:flavin-dependent dehydrogenase